MPSFFGRSRTWPLDAITSYPAPRYFLMVLAFAGDSTTTSVFMGTRTFTALLGRLQGPRNPDAGEPTHKHKPFQVVIRETRPEGPETTTLSRVRVKSNA